MRRHRLARHPDRGAAPLRQQWPLFNLVGRGYQRPFELATLRLQDKLEVLGRWHTYVPSDYHLSQRGSTFLLDGDNTLQFVHRDAGILGFSAIMTRPLSFLEPWLGASETCKLSD